MHQGRTGSLLGGALFLSGAAMLALVEGRYWVLLYLAAWAWLGWILLFSALGSVRYPPARRRRLPRRVRGQRGALVL